MIPALLGRYEIARISLEHPLISLVRTTDGINFETLSRERGSESDDASSAERRAVAVALLDIKDGTVRYLDRTTKPPREIIAEQLEFQASDLSYGDALRFELSAAAFGARIPNVKASGAVGPVEPEDVAATPLDLVAQLDEIDSSALLQVISAPAELRLDGPVSAKLEVGGMLSAWTLNFALNAESARVGVGGVADKPRGIPLMVSGHVARRDDVTFVVDSIDVAASASTLTASGTVTTGKASTAYGISLSGTGLSLADCASLLPSLRDAEPQGHADVALEITKPAAATSPAIEGRVGLDGVGFRLGESLPPVSQLSGIVSFDGRRATLGPSDLRVGGAPASIRAGVDNVFAPVVRFQFSSPGFPLAALAETQSADTIEGLDIAGRVFLTGASPRITAEMHAAGAIVSGLPMKNLTATVNHEKGSTSVEPISFDSCGGRLRGAATYSATTGSSTTPRLGLEVHAGDLIITQLGAALADSRSAPVSGTMGFDLVADAAGTDWPTIRRSLSGRGGFDLTKGAILGINIPEVTLERLSGVPGLSALLPPRLRSDFPALFGHEDTRFESLTSSFQIENGRLQTRDLALVAPDFTIGAVGGMGLDLSIDLAATLTTSLPTVHSPGIITRIWPESVSSIRISLDCETIVP